MAESNEEDYKLILSLVKGFFKTKKIIIISIGVFLLLGLIYVVVTPKTYSSRVLFITQDSSSVQSGGLGGIASLLSGGSKSTGTNDIPTFLYPQIINSWKFRKQLFDIPLKLKNEDSLISLKRYSLEKEKLSTGQIIAKYTIGLPKLLFGKKQKSANVNHQIDSLEYVSKTDKRVLQSIKEKLSFNINKEDGTLEIKTFIKEEPVAAAQLAQSVQLKLQKEIVRYRIAKASEKYDFINKQYIEAKQKYNDAQQRLASYSDRNLFNSTQSSLIHKNQLENEVLLLFTIYSDLEQQRVTQSIKIEEDTPNFTIITPSRVPLVADNKGTPLILVLSMVLGFIFSLIRFIFIQCKDYLKTLWATV